MNGIRDILRIIQVVSCIVGRMAKLGAVDANMRRSFDYLSQYSDDDGSKSSFGEYASNGPMTKSQNSSLVHEFIYGVYAYESLYNAVNKDITTFLPIGELINHIND